MLVVHGGRDGVIPPEDGRRVARELGERAELRFEPDGSHSCNDLHVTIRPSVADWVHARLVG